MEKRGGGETESVEKFRSSLGFHEKVRTQRYIFLVYTLQFQNQAIPPTSI